MVFSSFSTDPNSDTYDEELATILEAMNSGRPTGDAPKGPKGTAKPNPKPKKKSKRPKGGDDGVAGDDGADPEEAEPKKPRSGKNVEPQINDPWA